MQKWHSREREDVLSTQYPPDLLIGKIGHVDGGYSYLHPDIVCGMTQYISIVAPSPAFEAKKLGGGVGAGSLALKASFMLEMNLE